MISTKDSTEAPTDSPIQPPILAEIDNDTAVFAAFSRFNKIIMLTKEIHPTLLKLLEVCVVQASEIKSQHRISPDGQLKSLVGHELAIDLDETKNLRDVPSNFGGQKTFELHNRVLQQFRKGDGCIKLGAITIIRAITHHIKQFVLDQIGG